MRVKSDIIRPFRHRRLVIEQLEQRRFLSVSYPVDPGGVDVESGILTITKRDRVGLWMSSHRGFGFSIWHREFWRKRARWRRHQPWRCGDEWRHGFI